MHGADLLRHLRTLPARLALAEALGDESERVSAYYLCPLSNLRKIVASGILSHSGAPPDRTDLSGAGVQGRRNADVNLTNNVGYLTRDVHSCVNLFWNPLNWTCRTFQHHALLKETSENNPDSGVLCILELSVGTMLSDQMYYWTASPKNIASSHFASYAQSLVTGERTNEDGEPYFDWDKIFSYGNTSDPQLNRKRSAELIVFHDPFFQDPQNSLPLPPTLVKRVLLPGTSVRRLTDSQDTFLAESGLPQTRFNLNHSTSVFFSKDDLLWPERQFGRNLGTIQRIDSDVVGKLNAAINAATEFETQNPALVPVAANFARPELATGKHGTAHISRVMFWAAYLAQYLPEEERRRIMLPLLCAAAIHDVCRESDREDTTHGAVAAERDREKITTLLAGSPLTASCFEAVRFHCLEDTECQNRDTIWQILKDADAIDRGRFGKPGQQGGCKSSSLRTPILRGTHGTNILWMAYYLAQMTRHIDLGTAPCLILTETLVNCLNTAFP